MYSDLYCHFGTAHDLCLQVIAEPLPNHSIHADTDRHVNFRSILFVTPSAVMRHAVESSSAFATENVCRCRNGMMTAWNVEDVQICFPSMQVHHGKGNKNACTVYSLFLYKIMRAVHIVETADIRLVQLYQGPEEKAYAHIGMLTYKPYKPS